MYLKISNLLWIIGAMFKSNSLYYELKYYIKNKQSYIRYINCWDRGIGKTYNLVKLACKYSYPIFVSKQCQVNHLKKMALTEFKKNIEIYCLKDNVVGKYFDFALFDEGLSYEQIQSIRAFSKVGYVNKDS